MSLERNIMDARRKILGVFGHIEALHLGARAEAELRANLATKFFFPTDRMHGMPLECGPIGTGPDYCAISWKRSERSGPILFEIIREDALDLVRPSPAD